MAYLLTIKREPPLNMEGSLHFFMDIGGLKDVGMGLFRERVQRR